jgi:hypothetical protein
VVAQKYSEESDIYILKDEVTLREWTVNSHKLKKFTTRPFLRHLQPSAGVEAPRTEFVRMDEAIPITDRSRDIEGYDTDISVKEVASLDAEVCEVTDAIDVSAPDSENPVLAPPRRAHKPFREHRDSYRHSTGITVQESGRRDERDKDDNETTLESLKEEEIDKIVGQVKEGTRILYEIKWKSDPVNTWQERATFNQTEILVEYWSNRPTKDIPRTFRKAVKKAGEATSRE